MANNDVHVTMTAATGQAQQAWLSIIGTLEQMESRLKRMGTTGAAAGRQTANELGNVATTAQRVGTTLGTLVGVGSPLAAMLTAVQLIRSEFEQWKTLSDESSSALLRRSKALSDVAANVGLGKTDAAGKPFGPVEMERLVSTEAARAGVPQTTLAESLPPLVSSTAGILPPDVMVKTAAAVARAYPQMALKPEEWGQVNRMVGELIKSQRAKGVEITPEQAMSAFASTFELSAAGTVEELGPTMGFLAERAMTNKANQLFESVAQVTAVGQAMVDPSGRRTATNVSMGFASALETIFKHAPELREKSDEEIRMAIRDATEETAPRLVRARKELLGSRAPGTTLEEIKAVGFQKGSMLGEQRAEAAVMAMFLKDSQVDRDIEAAKKSTANMLEQKTVQQLFAQWAEQAQSAQMLPVQQEIRRQVSAEGGSLAMTDPVRRANILDRAAEVLKKTQSGGALGSTGIGAATWMARTLGSEDPLRIGQAAKESMELAIAEKQQQLKATSDVREKTQLQTQIEALQSARADFQKDIRSIETERKESEGAFDISTPKGMRKRQQLELEPGTLRRKPSRFAAERKFEQQALRGFMRSLLIDEGVSEQSAEQAVGIGLSPQPGESAAQSLRKFVDLRSQFATMDKRFRPEQLATMGERERARAEADVSGEARALERARNVLEGRMVDALERLTIEIQKQTNIKVPGGVLPPLVPLPPGAVMIPGIQGRF